MAIIFDGREFALAKEKKLRGEVISLRSNGIIPHLASIIIGEDAASKLYVGLKKKAAEKIGAELDIYYFSENTGTEDILHLIDSLNRDGNVHGIMVQLPLPQNLAFEKNKIIDSIDPKKDVDGLRRDSVFLHPTSKAVVDILKDAEEKLDLKPRIVCVVGSTGMVGTPLVKELKNENYTVIEVNAETKDLKSKLSQADVVISATGVPGLIKPSMVKKGVLAIDVGSPVGDFDASVSGKAKFFTPVPGGVGPITISCLLENLVENI